jgi:hypothetical protein
MFLYTARGRLAMFESSMRHRFSGGVHRSLIGAKKTKSDERRNGMQQRQLPLLRVCRQGKDIATHKPTILRTNAG